MAAKMAESCGDGPKWAYVMEGWGKEGGKGARGARRQGEGGRAKGEGGRGEGEGGRGGKVENGGKFDQGYYYRQNGRKFETSSTKNCLVGGCVRLVH